MLDGRVLRIVAQRHARVIAAMQVSLKHTLSHTLSLPHTLSLTLSISLSHTHTHTHSHSHTLSNPLSLKHSLPFSLFHTHTLPCRCAPISPYSGRDCVKSLRSASARASASIVDFGCGRNLDRVRGLRKTKKCDIWRPS